MAPTTRSQAAKARSLQQSDSTSTQPRVSDFPPCRLLDLTGELRNRIYRYALVDPDQLPIPITVDGYARPGLLSTCKQIRQEALKIYLYENQLRFKITRFDPLPMQRFYATLLPMGIQPARNDLQLSGDPDGFSNPSWPNLTTWLCEFHHNRVTMRMKSPSELLKLGTLCVGIRVVIYIIAAMFETVDKMSHHPWSVVKSIIEVSRPALIAIDAQWAED